jgi:hypothetical protein
MSFNVGNGSRDVANKNNEFSRSKNMEKGRRGN